MTGWLILGAMIALAAVMLWRLAQPARGVVAIGVVALVLACAGYAWQGKPGLSGSPAAGRPPEAQGESAFAALRGTMMAEVGSTASLLAAADAFHRRGHDDHAVAILRGQLSRTPDNSDLWTGLGNAIVLYSNGIVPPAAKLAFDRAAAISPRHPAPPFFYGLALAQAGRVDEAVVVWRRLLAMTPADAPWRPQIEAALTLAGGVPPRE